MRINLQVPFHEKHEAKMLGAMWDVARKTWYVDNPENLKKFAKWMDKKVQAFYSKSTPGDKDV